MSEPTEEEDTAEHHQPASPQRKPWSAPTLTVRSIEEVTHGTRATDTTDGPSFFFS